MKRRVMTPLLNSVIIHYHIERRKKSSIPFFCLIKLGFLFICVPTPSDFWPRRQDLLYENAQESKTFYETRKSGRYCRLWLRVGRWCGFDKCLASQQETWFLSLSLSLSMSPLSLRLLSIEKRWRLQIELRRGGLDGEDRTGRASERHDPQLLSRNIDIPSAFRFVLSARNCRDSL